jgi:O-acetyl-ADP-ribose deacetylase
MPSRRNTDFMNGKVKTKVGDITQEAVDAIVNAANSSLMGGGGVDGAIHRAGGSAILQECKKIRTKQYPDGLPTGQAVITTAGKMPSKYVIHTVGPIYRKAGKKAPDLLASCYKQSLILAAENNLKSIAFPSISTGVFGYPKDEAAQVASKAISDFLKQHPDFGEIRLVFFANSDLEEFLKHCIWNS